MGRPYRQDRCVRVVDAAAATSRREGAVRFNVGFATAIRWMASVEANGTVAARPQGRPRISKLDPHEPFPRDLIDGKPPGACPRLNAGQRGVLRTLVEQGPPPAARRPWRGALALV